MCIQFRFHITYFITIDEVFQAFQHKQYIGNTQYTQFILVNQRLVKCPRKMAKKIGVFPNDVGKYMKVNFR